MTNRNPKDELKEHTTYLHKRDVTNPFDVPSGYFDGLPDNVLQRVKADPKIVSLPPRRSTVWLNVAAAVAALVLTAIPFLKPGELTAPAIEAVAMNDVSNADLYNYLSEDVATIHVNDIAAGLPDEKLDTIAHELIAVSAAAYDDAAFDIAQLDFEDIESM